MKPTRRSFGGFFLAITIVAISHDAQAIDPDRTTTLRRQLSLFLSLSQTRQQQIRDLDRDLYALDENKQKQLRKVMNNYLIWLDRLPESERKKLNAPGMLADDRLRVVRQIRLQEWVDSQPQTYRKKYDEVKKDLEERSKLIDHWRDEEQSREEEWVLAQRLQTEQARKGLVEMFEHPEMKANLDPYLRNLARFVDGKQRQDLEAAIRAKDTGFYIDSGRYIYTLSERIHIIPGPDTGPRTLDQLPAPVRAVLPDQKDRLAFPMFKKATMVPPRWPDYARAVTKYARDQKIKLPQELGPCRPGEMPGDVKSFIELKLIPELSKTEPGRRELKLLAGLEGSWPEYPDKLVELARNHKMTIPGWTLPLPDLWATNFKIPKKDRPKL